MIKFEFPPVGSKNCAVPLATPISGARTAHEKGVHVAGLLHLLKMAEAARKGAGRALLFLVAGLVSAVAMWSSSGPHLELSLLDTAVNAVPGGELSEHPTASRLTPSGEGRMAVRRSAPAEFDLELRAAEFEKEDEEGKFKSLAARGPYHQIPSFEAASARRPRGSSDGFVHPVGDSRELPRGPPRRS